MPLVFSYMNTCNEQKHAYKDDNTNYYPNHNFSQATEVCSNNKNSIIIIIRTQLRYGLLCTVVMSISRTQLGGVQKLAANTVTINPFIVDFPNPKIPRSIHLSVYALIDIGRLN